ncbi:MAG: histidine kinase [Chitinophagaceae bacterium]|nr:histidine kinase [Chitinophagaceae bacterium]
MSILFIYLYYYRFKDAQEKFREVVANQERLKYEKITAQYKSLQNHISPHFIFNCLGGLDRMIRENPKEATRVIYSLSDCLQHILITLEKGTITLEEELIFIHKYEELLHIRFPGSIQISKFIDQVHYHKKIPPCIMQMLIENAVKHNNFNSENKLTIIISSLDGDRLSISNNYAAKKEENGQIRMGTGLDNIRQRFQLLTDEQIIIQQTSSLFTANLPLLNNE